ncbi:hypothetical protein ACLUTX_19765 [Enterobacterales bacterium AE_CKDN230030158-1A_HGKHYDSX7]
MLPDFIHQRQIQPERIKSVPSELIEEVLSSFKSFAISTEFGHFRHQESYDSKAFEKVLTEELEDIWRQVQPDNADSQGRVGFGKERLGANMNTLQIYLLDSLCGACKAGDMAEAMTTVAELLDVQRAISEREGSMFHSFLNDFLTSAAAVDRAALRHAPTNALKEVLLQEWDATAGEYQSRADFARIVGQREGVKYRTLYDWITAHEKRPD